LHSISPVLHKFDTAVEFVNFAFVAFGSWYEAPAIIAHIDTRC
jgi:hypothetical protein